MEDTFTITLPDGISPPDLDAIQAELRQVDGISDLGSMDALSVTPQEVMLWVQVATSVFGAVGAALPLIEKVRALLRKRQIRGAQVTLADGTVIRFDEVNADEIGRLLDAARGGN